MARRFVRKNENFKCRNCGFEVIGTGYTNHCPNCLWSRHLDVFPGDRSEACKGTMEPIELQKRGQEFLVIHKCLVCGKTSRNRLAEDDNLEAIIDLFQGSS